MESALKSALSGTLVNKFSTKSPRRRRSYNGKQRTMQTKLNTELVTVFDEIARRMGLTRYALMQVCLTHYIISERGMATIERIIMGDDPSDELHKTAMLYFAALRSSPSNQAQPAGRREAGEAIRAKATSTSSENIKEET